MGSVASIIPERAQVHHSIRNSLDSHDTVEVLAAVYAASKFAAHSRFAYLTTKLHKFSHLLYISEHLLWACAIKLLLWSKGWTLLRSWNWGLFQFCSTCTIQLQRLPWSCFVCYLLANFLNTIFRSENWEESWSKAIRQRNFCSLHLTLSRNWQKKHWLTFLIKLVCRKKFEPLFLSINFSRYHSYYLVWKASHAWTFKNTSFGNWKFWLMKELFIGLQHQWLLWCQKHKATCPTLTGKNCWLLHLTYLLFCRIQRPLAKSNCIQVRACL